MALASLQAAPLALAAALFWAEGAWGARRLGWDARLRAVGRLSLALAPVLLPALFALVAFGHPSPLVLAGAYDRRHMSVFRALELLVDPNLGLLPYVPLTLALALVLALVRPARRRTESEERASPAWLLAAVALVALASTGAANWNHGTVGPSRYGLWLLPFLFVLLAEALEGSSGRAPPGRAAAGRPRRAHPGHDRLRPRRRPRPRGLHAALRGRPLGPRALARPLQPDDARSSSSGRNTGRSTPTSH